MNATIYTINTCNFCKSAKDFFTSKNIPFTEKNVEQDKAALDEMLKLSDSFAGVPFTVITKDDGTTVSLKGFTLQEFEHATSGGMDMSTPNIPTVPNVPNDMASAPVVEPTPIDISTSPNVPVTPNLPTETVATPAEPVSAPEPTTPSVVEPVAPAVEPIPTPEPIAETPASNAVDMDLNTPATSNVADNVPTTPTLPNSPAPDDDVDKKLDTLLQSLQSKTTESTPEPVVEAPATVEPVSAPMSQMPLNTPAEPMPTPTQDTNINNPLYQAAEPVPSVESAPQMAPISLNTPTETPTPMDTPAPAVTTEAAPSIPDFKPKM